MHDHLPNGWVRTTLGEVCAINPRDPIHESPPDHTQVSFVPMAAVEEETGRLAASQIRTLSSVRRGYTPFKENDVIFAKITPCMENGKIALATNLKNGVGYGSTEFFVFRPYAGVLPRFILQFLLQPSLRENAERQMTGAVGQKRVPASYLSNYDLLLPPMEEQERIVAKLDAALSRVERGEAVVRRAQDRLQRYRSAVLETAVGGELTRGWRIAHQKQGNRNETGEALLRRVLAARRARWEESEISRFREKGKLPKDEHWKTRYREPGPPDTMDLPELPETWAWASLEMVAAIGSGISVSQNRVLKNAIELPYLRVANVLRGRLDLNDIKTMRVEKDRADEYFLHIDDVLFNEGGDRDKLGRGWVWEGQIPRCVHQNHVFRARLADPSLLNPKLVSHWGNTFGQNFFVKHGKQTTNLASINRSVLGKLPVPIVPMEEQAEILREVDHRLTAADKLRVALEQQLERVRATRQALRDQAFAGGLVPQNSNDEPASVLLERIRLAREAEGQKPKVKRVSKSPSKIKVSRRRDLLAVLEENRTPMTPEELFRASGHSQDSVDEFFAELRVLMTSCESR